MATFEIPAINFSNFEKDFIKLQKKGAKLGVTVQYTVTGSVEKPVPGKDEKMTYAVVEVSGDRPKINGYEFVATIEHTEHGNIVGCSGAEHAVKVTEELRFCESHCAHCKTKRYRKYTYALLKEGTEEYIIVGKQCLRDFLGHIDPKMLANIHTWLKTFEESKDYGDIKMWGGNAENWFVQDYLVTVAQLTINHGFVTGKQAQILDKATTADLAANIMNSSNKIKLEITEQAKDLAARAYEWAFNLQAKTAFEQNMYIYARKHTMYASGSGVIAYIVPAYLKSVGQDVEAKAEEKAPKKPSEFQGIVGQRKNFKGLRVKKAISLESMYDQTLYILEDSDGNAFKWIKSNGGLDPEAELEITATVKAHDTYKDRQSNETRQTVITRGKVH